MTVNKTLRDKLRECKQQCDAYHDFIEDTTSKFADHTCSIINQQPDIVERKSLRENLNRYKQKSEENNKKIVDISMKIAAQKFLNYRYNY